MRYRITAPVARYEGVIAGTRFVDGVAEVDADASALAYCRRRRYVIEPVEHATEEATPAASRPSTSASKGDWVAYATARGADPEDADKATKAELIELYG